MSGEIWEYPAKTLFKEGELSRIKKDIKKAKESGWTIEQTADFFDIPLEQVSEEYRRLEKAED